MAARHTFRAVLILVLSDREAHQVVERVVVRIAVAMMDLMAVRDRAAGSFPASARLIVSGSRVHFHILST
jgi:hypothetical protein